MPGEKARSYASSSASSAAWRSRRSWAPVRGGGVALRSAPACMGSGVRKSCSSVRVWLCWRAVWRALRGGGEGVLVGVGWLVVGERGEREVCGSIGRGTYVSMASLSGSVSVGVKAWQRKVCRAETASWIWWTWCEMEMVVEVAWERDAGREVVLLLGGRVEAVGWVFGSVQGDCGTHAGDLNAGADVGATLGNGRFPDGRAYGCEVCFWKCLK